MKESHILLTIRQYIKNNRSLQEVVASVQSLQGKYNDFSAPHFRESEDFKNLQHMIEMLEFHSLEQALSKMMVPDSMLVIPIAN